MPQDPDFEKYGELYGEGVLLQTATIETASTSDVISQKTDGLETLQPAGVDTWSDTVMKSLNRQIVEHRETTSRI